MVIDEVKKYARYCIYGAQVVAYGAYMAISHLCEKKPDCFIVTNLRDNPSSIDGIPVRRLDGFAKDTLIVVGVTELLQDEVISYLNKYKYKNITILSQHEEHILMSAYFESIGKFSILSYDAVYPPVDLVLYEVRNHRDCPLKDHPMLLKHERPIQAGAERSDIRIADILDNKGVNISEKNKQYCEMTATYWVWKNTKHAWKGIEHYRRHLLVKPEMIKNDIDVVLPLPYICYPNTISQLRRFVSEGVLQALLKALKYIHPRTYSVYYEILSGKYQYTYNMVCAKAEIFDTYCEWFFNITEYMEKLADDVPEIKNTRALSYVAEALTNLYFMSKREQLNILHAEKKIYT